jgi:hypothetical protein
MAMLISAFFRLARIVDAVAGHGYELVAGL